MFTQDRVSGASCKAFATLVPPRGEWIAKRQFPDALFTIPGELNLVNSQMASANTIDARFDVNPTLPGVPDPYPIYHAVRKADPVHWCPEAKLWAIMRYDDALETLKDPRLSRQAYLDSLERRTGPQPVIQMQRGEMVFMDNPRHGAIRQIIAELIGAQSVHDLQPLIDSLVEEKFAAISSRGSFDAIADYFLTLPTEVSAAWLGVPEQDRKWITSLIFPLVSGRGVARDPETTAAANKVAVDLRAYFDQLISQRRVATTGDLISSFLAAQAQNPSRMTDDALISLILAVFAGGHTPGVNAMACTLLAILENPDQLARLRADPALLPSAVEEGFRYTTATQAPNPSAALEDFELRGKAIRKGDAVTVILGSANRDPEVFPDPDRFDVARTPNRHLAFSAGSHYCIGATLTRLEAQSALGALTQRLRDMRLACDPAELKWIPHDRFRMLAALPISFRTA
jgi:pimeloyl-[acyl-carrier protein] synthase